MEDVVELLSGRIAVIGGGYTGFAAAVILAAAGRSVTVFEAARTLGGRARRVDAVRVGIAGAEAQVVAGDAEATSGRAEGEGGGQPRQVFQ